MSHEQNNIIRNVLGHVNVDSESAQKWLDMMYKFYNAPISKTNLKARHHLSVKQLDITRKILFSKDNADNTYGVYDKIRREREQKREHDHEPIKYENKLTRYRQYMDEILDD